MLNKPCLPFPLVLAGLLAALPTRCAAPPAPVVYHSLLGADTGAATAVRADGPALVVGPVSVPDLLHNTRLATGSDGRFQRRGQRQRGDFKFRADPACRAYMSEVGQQAVRNIDTGAPAAAQRHPRGDS